MESVDSFWSDEQVYVSIETSCVHPETISCIMRVPPLNPTVWNGLDSIIRKPSFFLSTVKPWHYMVLTSHTVSDYPTHTRRDYTDGHSDQPWNRLPMEPTISNRYIQLPSTSLFSARKLKLSKRPETRLRASIYTTNQYNITHSALHELWSDWEPPSLQRQLDPLSRIIKDSHNKYEVGCDCFTRVSLAFHSLQ